jgi:hypothetical protein
VTGFLEINAQKSDTSNVYYQALKLHLDYLNSYNERRPKESSLITHYLVEQNDYTTDSLPETISYFTIEILTRKDIYERTKNKKTIHLIALRPARWENGKLVINVIDFGVSRKGKHFYYINGGGSSFEIVANGEGDDLKLKILFQGGI